MSRNSARPFQAEVQLVGFLQLCWGVVSFPSRSADAQRWGNLWTRMLRQSVPKQTPSQNPAEKLEAQNRPRILCFERFAKFSCFPAGRTARSRVWTRARHRRRPSMRLRGVGWKESPGPINYGKCPITAWNSNTIQGQFTKSKGVLRGRVWHGSA